MIDEKHSADHDLLVTIHTKLERALDDIRELKDGTTSRITHLEAEKTDRKDFETLQKDYDNRLKWLERIAYGGIGILSVIEMYFKIVK